MRTERTPRRIFIVVFLIRGNNVAAWHGIGPYFLGCAEQPTTNARLAGTMTAFMEPSKYMVI